MKLKKFKEKNNKRIGIILFTITCILLVSGVMLYRTFAIFEVRTNQNVIKGTVQDPGDIYFAFYKDNQIQKEMPKKEDGYVLDEEASYCGVTGENDSEIKVFVSEDNMIHVSGVTSSRTKCNLYFVKGAYLLGKGVPIVESGEGLYEVKHNEVSGINEGFKETEYRYAGASPNNYIKFNNENWRMIGLVNVLTSENKVEQRIKIVRNDLLGYLPWSISCTSLNSCQTPIDWNSAVLQTILNQNYFQSDFISYYYKEHGSGTVMLSTLDFSENYLKDKYASMIDKVFWNIGNLDINLYNNNQDKHALYLLERQNKETWEGKVALLYPSDVTYSFNDNSFLESNIWFWSLRYTSSSVGFAGVDVLVNSKVNLGPDSIAVQHYVYPTLYLKSNVKIINNQNDGSKEHPYELIQIMI